MLLFLIMDLLVKNIVIIGASAAGLTAAQKLRQLLPKASITVITQEPLPLYNKCSLADWCAGTKKAQDVELASSDKLMQNGITLLSHMRVSAIDTAKQQVIIETGQFISYDSLLLCTGSSPFIPSFINKNSCSEGIFAFHTYKDIESINTYIQEKSIKRVVVVGAGLTGLEAADAFLKKGLHVSVVDQAMEPLELVNNLEVTDRICTAMKNAAVDWLPGVRVTEVLSESNGNITSVALSNGQRIETQLLIWACGVRPHNQLARDALIALHNDRWIQVDDFFRTNIKNIYACGDVIISKNCITNQPHVTSSWPDAIMQGITVAKIIAGSEVGYQGIMPYAHSHFFGLDIAWGGVQLIQQQIPEGFTLKINNNPERFEYYLYKNSILYGFLQIGNHIEPGVYKRQLGINFIKNNR